MATCECGKVRPLIEANFSITSHTFRIQLPVNYLKSWKCAAVLKPDGTAHDERDEVIGQGGGIGGGAAGGLGGGGGVGAMQTGGQQQRPFGGFVVGSTTSDATGMGGAGGNGGNGSNANNTTKYYKRGIISHPNQVPWH